MPDEALSCYTSYTVQRALKFNSSIQWPLNNRIQVTMFWQSSLQMDISVTGHQPGFLSALYVFHFSCRVLTVHCARVACRYCVYKVLREWQSRKRIFRSIDARSIESGGNVLMQRSSRLNRLKECLHGQTQANSLVGTSTSALKLSHHTRPSQHLHSEHQLSVAGYFSALKAKRLQRVGRRISDSPRSTAF